MKLHIVVAGYLIHKNRLLLIHHKKLKKWIPPGGHINENETPDDALRRELKEELNLDVEILNRTDIPMDGNIQQQLAVPFFVGVHNVGDHDHYCLYYLCKTKNTEGLSINKSELKDFAWFSVQELKQKSIQEDVRNIGLKAFELLGSLK